MLEIFGDYSLFVEVFLFVTSILMCVFVLMLLLNHKPFGFFKLFNKKRRIIINGVINIIKTEPNEWKHLGISEKECESHDLYVDDSWFTRAHIKSKTFERGKTLKLNLTFLEAIQLSFYFRKIKNYKDKIEQQKATEALILVATKMEKL